MNEVATVKTRSKFAVMFSLSVVLKAENPAFRVCMDLLAHHNRIFNNMLYMPQSNTQDTPWIAVHSNPHRWNDYEDLQRRHIPSSRPSINYDAPMLKPRAISFLHGSAVFALSCRVCLTSKDQYELLSISEIPKTLSDVTQVLRTSCFYDDVSSSVLLVIVMAVTPTSTTYLLAMRGASYRNVESSIEEEQWIFFVHAHLQEDNGPSEVEGDDKSGEWHSHNARILDTSEYDIPPSDVRERGARKFSWLFSCRVRRLQAGSEDWPEVLILLEDYRLKCAAGFCAAYCRNLESNIEEARRIILVDVPNFFNLSELDVLREEMKINLQEENGSSEVKDEVFVEDDNSAEVEEDLGEYED
ncbi:hypothetical protein NEOLEDRAFT_1151514 [Neolentinus lepideus HHB14362 ss-1]|uniref:Uncharacterized protein n=1 Tax=Neolentinus lepideus HHB14362 ss-1 TaxID=1314782 RepID=A0A165NX05_9AGAM|nr:hypothetical protein NEOLEDRAFT_1151514 [Neolentinus lepideus HHB14362 ss-1]